MFNLFGVREGLRERKEKEPPKPPKLTKKKDVLQHDTSRYFSFIRWDGSTLSPNVRTLLDILGRGVKTSDIIIHNAGQGNLYFRFYDVGVPAVEKTQSTIDSAPNFQSPSIIDSGANWYPVIQFYRKEEIFVGGAGEQLVSPFVLGVHISGRDVPIRITNIIDPLTGRPVVLLRYFDGVGLVDRMGTFVISSVDPRQPGAGAGAAQPGAGASQPALEDFETAQVAQGEQPYGGYSVGDLGSYSEFGKRRKNGKVNLNFNLKNVNKDIKYLKST